MALIVPNATATGSSNKYSNINQAEPDSVDFEALGNTLNYIRSGFVVTVGASNAVSITAGVTIINGTPYSASSASFTVNPGAATRFDLIVVRLSGSTATTTLLSGTEDAVNPTLPQSKSVISGAGTSANYDPATDALIATVYTVPSTALASSNIVDKRIISTAPVTYTVSGVPTTNAKDVIGDTAIYNGDSYIKNTSSTWAKLTTSTEVEAAKIPIGGMFPFAGTYNTSASPSVAYYFECDGSSKDTTTYANLFAAIGYTFGGSGANFNLPNLTGDTGVVGASPAEINTSGKIASSSNTASVVLPQHNHTYTTTIGSKTGSVYVGPKTGYPSTNTNLSGSVTGTSHSHYTGDGQSYPNRAFPVSITNAYPTDGYVIPPYSQQGSNGMAIKSTADVLTGNSSTGGTATITIPTSLAISTDIGTVSISTNIGSPTGTTDNQGTASASMSILSKSIRVRWYIRHT